MNFKLLNDMVNYIEDNLTEEIDYNELAKIVGISEYSLQRIFMFITSMSIKEYIRKRRMSKAFEELKTTNIKINNLAFKYCYNSPISFSRAFKNTFGITPNKCKSSKNCKLYPKLIFNENNNLCKELNYEIKELDELTLYGYSINTNNKKDYTYKIRKLYNKLKNSHIHDKMDNNGMYALATINKNFYEYYLGSFKKYPNSNKFNIPKFKYAIFNVGSRKQDDIINKIDTIYKEWLISTNHKIINEFHLESYENDNCYIYIPIEE